MLIDNEYNSAEKKTVLVYAWGRNEEGELGVQGSKIIG